ncbi:MAG: MarR family transcriptional regulator [Burkholderiaceae bacterium]
MSKPATSASSRKQTFYSAALLLSSKDSNIGLLIKQVQSSMNRMIDQHVSPLGLTAMQWRPLVMIRYMNINTPAELARGAHVDTGAMTRTLDRLEAKGFVTRHRCPEDRRVVRIALSETGIAVAEQIMPAIAAALNTHLQGFSKAEIETLIGLLLRVRANGLPGTDLPCAKEP